MPESLDKKFEIDFKKSLGKAIKAAFPKRVHLAAMVEDELYESLDDITSNEPDYKIVIRNLVQWAQTEGKLCDLVIGASRHKPNNPQLKTFIAENLRNLLIIDKNPGSNIKDQLDSWIACLRKIKIFEQSVFPTFKEVFPDLEKEYHELAKNTLEPSQSNDFKLLIILSLLLKGYHGYESKDESRLLTFFQIVIDQKPTPLEPIPPIPPPEPWKKIGYLLVLFTPISIFIFAIYRGLQAPIVYPPFNTDSNQISSTDRIQYIDYGSSSNWLTLANEAGEVGRWKFNLESFGQPISISITTGLALSSLASYPKDDNILFYVVKDGENNQSWVYQDSTNPNTLEHQGNKLCRLKDSEPVDHYIAIDESGKYMVVASNDDDEPRIYVLDLAANNGIGTEGQDCKIVKGSLEGSINRADLAVGDKIAGGVLAIEIDSENPSQFITVHRNNFNENNVDNNSLIFVWEVGSTQPEDKRIIEPRPGDISSISLSPSERLLAIGYSGGDIDLYSYPFPSDSASLTPRRHIDRSLSGFLDTQSNIDSIGTFVDFTQNDSFLLTAGKIKSYQFCFKLWDVDKILANANEVQPAYSYLAFDELNSVEVLSDDEKLIVFSAGKDKVGDDEEYPYSLKIWDFVDKVSEYSECPRN